MADKIKLFGVFLGIFIFFVTFMTAYLNEDIDTNVNIFGTDMSVRSLIITTSFDLILWFSNLFWRTWRRPNTIFLVDKITVNWV